VLRIFEPPLTITKERKIIIMRTDKSVERLASIRKQMPAALKQSTVHDTIRVFQYFIHVAIVERQVKIAPRRISAATESIYGHACGGI
jgi:hypothetical protein